MSDRYTVHDATILAGARNLLVTIAGELLQGIGYDDQVNIEHFGEGIHATVSAAQACIDASHALDKAIAEMTAYQFRGR